MRNESTKSEHSNENYRSVQQQQQQTQQQIHDNNSNSNPTSSAKQMSSQTSGKEREKGGQHEEGGSDKKAQPTVGSNVAAGVPPTPPSHGLKVAQTPAIPAGVATQQDTNNQNAMINVGTAQSVESDVLAPETLLLDQVDLQVKQAAVEHITNIR